MPDPPVLCPWPGWAVLSAQDSGILKWGTFWRFPFPRGQLLSCRVAAYSGVLWGPSRGPTPSTVQTAPSLHPSSRLPGPAHYQESSCQNSGVFLVTPPPGASPPACHCGPRACPPPLSPRSPAATSCPTSELTPTVGSASQDFRARRWEWCWLREEQGPGKTPRRSPFFWLLPLPGGGSRAGRPWEVRDMQGPDPV